MTMRALLVLTAALLPWASAFLLSQPQRQRERALSKHHSRASSGASWQKSMLSSGTPDLDNLPFAVSSSGFPSLGDGFPSMGNGDGGFPSLGEISVSRPPKRGVLVRNMPADSSHEIRVVDKDYKLGITAVVERIAMVKQARFALCRTKDRGAAILDDLVFPVDVDAVEMAPLIKTANAMLRKKGLELLWTAHTLTVKGLDRPDTEYMRWKKPFNERYHQQHHSFGGGVPATTTTSPTATTTEDSTTTASEEEETAGVEDVDSLITTDEDGDDVGMEEGGEGGMLDDDLAAMMMMGDEVLDGASYDRMDAAFFADVNDEEYVGDSPEGLDKRPLLLEPDMLCEFDYKRVKYKVVVYEEPVMLVAQWNDDGTWRLLKSVEAELVEDAIAYQQLQNLEVEMVDA